MSERILLTGASGFLGGALFQVLENLQNVSVTRVCRKTIESSEDGWIVLGSFDGNTDFSQALQGVSVVIHAAARAHVMRDEVVDVLGEYRKVNVDATLRLARQAAQAGVRRFIFISSIKVNGEQTLLGRPFTENDAPKPEDAYGISKYEAEQGLLAMARETRMEVVIIRPPLVYGPGVKGNFASMAKWVKAGVPLPFGAIHNRRSLVALDNLVSLIVTCVEHPAAANQIFLVSDGEDLSTSDLLRRLAVASDRPSRLTPVPEKLLLSGLSFVGKRMIAHRLLGSLQVDSAKARNLLEWTPPVTVDEGLKRCFVTKG